MAHIITTGIIWGQQNSREQSVRKLAKEKGVTGIAVWFNHEQITLDGDPDTISHLRRAMKFGVATEAVEESFLGR
ncbi:hypothetical protein NA56DRAFT_642102 [Hyaloscypha hepaticicola]|uniref:Fungal-type protein kinase domain-containing protein n=1 Tax=Hyaloscypha hepaticicola TaxID=2082293 RepID=A0A2J6QHU0_9HELO|nr:hypothetical protein NA56DRAFT_642102 [Hyaloscypha hepaticicola]